MHPRRCREVPRVAVFLRDGEEIAACPEERPAAVRRDLEIGDFLAHVAQASPSAVKILPDGDRELLHLLGGQVHEIDGAAVLEGDGVVAEGWELHVKFGEVRDLPCFARRHVVHIEIHALALIAVGGEIHLRAGPHRNDVLRRVAGNVGDAPGVEIVDPDIVGLAAAVAFPGAELAEHAVVRHLLAIGREGAESPAREGKLFGESSVAAYRKELPDKIIGFMLAGAIDNGCIVLPGHDDVVRPHPVRDVVAAEHCGRGQTAWNAAVGGHQVDFGVPVVLACKGDTLPVRGETREHFVADIGRQPAGCTSCGGHGEEVTRIGEDNAVAVHRGETEKPGFILCDGCCRRQKQQTREQHSDVGHNCFL